MFGPVGFAGGPGRARAGGRSGPPRPTGRGGPHHERPGISAKECKTDRKILCKPHVKQLLSNPRVIRASCLTAERVPRGSASRQPDGLVGLVVLSVSLFSPNESAHWRKRKVVACAGKRSIHWAAAKCFQTSMRVLSVSI